MNRLHTRIDTDGGVATLTLARPEIRNALTGPEMLEEVVSAFTDPPGDARVMVITGEGTAFSAGGNVKDMEERTGMFAGSPSEIVDGYRLGIQNLTRAVATTDVVTIAAVNGPAVGAGFDLVLGCDLRIGAAEAWFAHTFVDLGIIPGDGGAWLLPRVVGWQRATELSLTARRVLAEEARELDILLEVVEPGDLLPRCMELANQIAAKPAHSVHLTKMLLRHARTMDLAGFLDFSAALQAISHTEPAHTEAVARYMERWKAT
ncbi:MAG: enoyl-CoA hydratase-related protein [Acidimicrobiia bacterium]